MFSHTPPARAAFVLAVLLTGCLPSNMSSRVSQPGTTRIEVQNQHWEDLTIYIDRDGTLQRLGVADGNTTRTFSVPKEGLASRGWIRLVALEAGRQVHTHSDVFGLRAGEKAVWRTGPQDHVTPVIITP